MEKDNRTPRASGSADGSNYWQLLNAADDALAVGDYPAAERRYLDACDLRETSPGRVFVTEKIGDGLRRLFSKGDASQTTPGLIGRWNRASRAFVQLFREQGDGIVREGVRLAELRPEDDAEHNQPILESALYLVARSRLFQDEPASAVPLLKGLFRTASRTGRPFSVELVRHDLPLTEEDRLWMARKGGELVEAFVEQGHLRQGALEAEEWAQVFLQLLQARYFGSSSRLAEERAWLEALTADRLLGRAVASVELYRAYLQINPVPGARPDEARVRLLELLANTHTMNFPVPRYQAALGAMQAAGLSEGSAAASRFQEALARLEFRRPDVEPTMARSPAWASLAVEPDGSVAVVFWWNNEPRDVAFWQTTSDDDALVEFLEPCDGRLLAADEATLAAVTGRWPDAPAPWTAQEFAAAMMESRLPAGGLETDSLVRLGLAETGPWRGGWQPGMGHSLLEPPHSSTQVETWQQGMAVNALQAGLTFLAVRSRIAEADLTLRAGIGEMARRGDPAARFLYEFLILDGDTHRALDASFEPWMLPLLWTRPDPYGWTTAGGGPVGAVAVEPGIRPDLGRSDLTIVTTGNAAAVLAAWGDGKQKWRVVLDRMDRLETLTQVAGGVVGPVTLIPPGGQVHSLQAALSCLDQLLATPQPGTDGLLALFHWTRLVETHNGDLLDYRQVRPRTVGTVPLYDRYVEVVSGLATDEPGLADDGSLDIETLRTWGGQFSQRVRKAGLVAGTVDHLGTDARALDSLWGVFEGSDASWVFLDSAAVHWSLHERGEFAIPELHGLLHSRGSRHLSLLSAAGWQRSELEELLTMWLQVFGGAYCLSLTDTHAPSLRLVDRGVRPEAQLLAAEELAATVTWIDHKFAEEGAGTVRLPQHGRAAVFWSQIRSGELALGGQGWSYLDNSTDSSFLPDAALVVPVLHSLSTAGMPVAEAANRAHWAEVDAQRSEYLTWQRKLCALEIASLMAGHWRSVDILDTRWWRLMCPLQITALNGAAESALLRPWGGERAAQLATNGIGRTFDLPGIGLAAGSAGAVDNRILETVSGWLERQPGAAAGAEPVAAAAVAPEPGVQILVGNLDLAWRGLHQFLLRAWERGEFKQWVLLVAEELPQGAADLVAAGGVAGFAVWSPDGMGQIPAPLVWVAPEDFADPGLRKLLAAQPPAFVIADDLANWLPTAARDAQDAALALRGILDMGAQSVVLRASGLTPSWLDFLVEACGATRSAAGQITGAEGPTDGTTVAEIGLAHPLCLDCGHPAGPAALANRLRILLTRLREVLVGVAGGAADTAAEGLPAPDRELLPLDWLGRLAGMSEHEVSEGLLLLRWAARLNGDSLSAAGEVRTGEVSGGHTLIIGQRYAELEVTLDRLGENLALLLPMWLEGAVVPGLLGCIDLEQPPVRIEARELALVDAFLSAVGSGTGTGLVYHCPHGLLNSAIRMVGWDGSSHEVLPALLGELAVFRSRTRDVLASSLETGAGFRVETGLKELRADELKFMGLGVVLGFWRWLGPSCGGAIHLVDLLTVADSPTVKQSPLGWNLFRAQLAPRFPVDIAEMPVVQENARSGQARFRSSLAKPRLGQLRRLLTTGTEASDDLDPVVARVHELTAGTGDPAFLVLKGMLGTGRHEALVRGLLRTLHQADDPGEITVFCPDDAVAAMVAREFLQRGYCLPVNIRVPAGSSGVPAGPNVLPALADSGSSVIVMCEVQRFDPETRYRVAQLGRGKLLVMTADAAASAEPWEHLFLTTPRANDIIELTGQRRLAKAVWSEVRALVSADQQARAGTRRHTRGHLESGYAANLVQSLARVVSAHEEGTLPGVLRLTTPLAADLEYIGGQLRDRGWLAVSEPRLDSMLLPGPREILAAATDVLARSGELALAFGVGGQAENQDQKDGTEKDGTENDGTENSGEQNELKTSSPAVVPELMTPLLLGREARQAWQEWSTNHEPNPDLTLAEFVGLIIGEPWANPFLRHADARRRCQDLLASWGSETLRDLLAMPLWEAWWHTMNDDLGGTGAVTRRPLVLLSDMARVPGCPVPGAVYLCLGTEPARQHYEFLGRVTDSALVLYQERSPLPGDVGSA